MRLSDKIISKTPELKPGPKSWTDKLPAEIGDELRRVKELYRAGSVQKTARQLAIQIVAECNAQGVNVVSVDSVRIWLTQD